MQNNIKFQFGNVVVVDDEDIGVIVKTWVNQKGVVSYDVYVRILNSIKSFEQDKIKHFVYSKELSKEERDYYY